MIFYFMQLRDNPGKVQAVRKTSEFYCFRSLLPRDFEEVKMCKCPVDPDYYENREKRLDELKSFNELGSYTKSKRFCVEFQWLLDWKHYINGGEHPGKVKTQKITNGLGKLSPDLKENTDFKVVNKEQLDFLTQIYGSQPKVRVKDFHRKHKRSESSVQSRLIEKNNNFEGLNNEHALVTIMDVDILPAGGRFAVSETVPSKCEKNLTAKFGIENPGFYCYLNSAIQCLFSCPQIFSYYSSSGKPKKTKFFSRIFYKIMQDIKKQETKVLRPIYLWKEIKKDFPAKSQHDFIDIFRYFIEKTSKENSEEHNILESTFKGSLKSTLKCGDCNFESNCYEDFLFISVPFTESLEKSIEKFLKPEEIYFYCSNCLKTTMGVKQFSISKSPKVLVIQLKRFLGQKSLNKISDHCVFHKYLNIPLNSDTIKYNLLSLTQHSGNINYGHYKSYCKRGTKWFKFNDSVFTKISLKEVLKKNLYVSFYSRCDS